MSAPESPTTVFEEENNSLLSYYIVLEFNLIVYSFP